MNIQFIPACIAILFNIFVQVNINTGNQLLNISSEIAWRVLITYLVYEAIIYFSNKTGFFSSN